MHDLELIRSNQNELERARWNDIEFVVFRSNSFYFVLNRDKLVRSIPF